MSTATPPLPHWDMTPVYPGLDSPAFAQGFADVVAAIADLRERFDEYGIALPATTPTPDEAARAFEATLPRYLATLDAAQTLAVYISCFVNTNSRDTLAQARQSELQRHLTTLAQLETRVTAWVGALDLDALLARSEAAQAHAYALQLMHAEARHLMSPAEEALAAELNQSAGSAWAKLHGNVASQLVVRVALPDGERELPMSAVRNLAYDPERATRQRAYAAELAAWEANAVPLAAALNSIKGEVGTLAARRGWESPLAESLFNSHIDRATLDAMLGAARAAVPDCRRYLRD
jgi:oligoendopeptidase F